MNDYNFGNVYYSSEYLWPDVSPPITQNRILQDMGTGPQNVTVILPVFNEEISIGSVILQAKKYSQRIIVVDNGSSDHTVDIAKEAGAEVIPNPRNSKMGILLEKGIITVCDSDIVIIMDIGVCHDPGLIPKMIDPLINEKFDLSAGICFPKSKSHLKNGLLINNKNTESKPIGFLALSKKCLLNIDFYNLSINSIRSILKEAEKNSLKAIHIDIQEEHEASLFRAYKIGVVMPAYNEELLISEAIDLVPAYVDKIYVINDGSKDRTAEILNNITDHRVFPIHHTVNKGVGAAIKTGYKQALADEMDLVAVMAGDNQMDPKQLPRLLMPIIEGKADYTKGNRLLSREMRQGMPPWRAFGNTILSLINKIGSGYWNVTDPQNGYTVVSKHVLESIDIDSIYPYYGYCNDLLLKMNAFDFRVLDVMMPARYGSEKSKIRYGKFILKVSPMIFKGFLWRLKMKYIVLDFHPLVLFYLASMLLIPLGFLFGLWIVLQKMILHGQVSENYPLLDTFISLVGVQFLFFAMFFDMQVNNKTYGKAY